MIYNTVAYFIGGCLILAILRRCGFSINYNNKVLLGKIKESDPTFSYSENNEFDDSTLCNEDEDIKDELICDKCQEKIDISLSSNIHNPEIQPSELYSPLKAFEFGPKEPSGLRTYFYFLQEIQFNPDFSIICHQKNAIIDIWISKNSKIDNVILISEKINELVSVIMKEDLINQAVYKNKCYNEIQFLLNMNSCFYIKNSRYLKNKDDIFKIAYDNKYELKINLILRSNCLGDLIDYEIGLIPIPWDRAEINKKYESLKIYFEKRYIEKFYLDSLGLFFNEIESILSDEKEIVDKEEKMDKSSSKVNINVIKEEENDLVNPISLKLQHEYSQNQTADDTNHLLHEESPVYENKKEK